MLIAHDSPDRQKEGIQGEEEEAGGGTEGGPTGSH